MSLFQHSVLNKYLKEANQAEMKSAYEKLTVYFHNPIIQQNIRDSKEEQWQEGFLTELFAKILGYTINPNPDFNLTTEFKNEKGAKKADGAILKDGAAVGVIELKSTSTKDLEAIRLQAFDYKANQSKCVFVITSNFEKIRFYINNAVDFEEFDLFRINFEQFQLLWLCLAKENLLKGLPLEMKEASLLKEENVTKKFYVDYTAFKRDLYNDLIENNLELEVFIGKEEKEIKLLLFKKSQKLLDRFLFIFFGEDRGLLPTNSIMKIIDKWNGDTNWGENRTLYSIFKQYFNFLNIGRPARGEREEIYSYNGGLFLTDEVLDKIIITDEVLNKHTKVLTAYDFETEVDVNILGHIFENSLNEIEEVSAQIEGAEVDLKKSKRKKDGVFYTPKYITKYIVENTVGKLCKEKKTELGILDFDYDKDFKLKTKRTIESVVEARVKNEVRRVIEKRKTNISVEGTNQLEILNKYRAWLLKLTICDPACGSGAFLNQALDFLIREHNFITELSQKITGDVSTMFIDIENQILENNIFGVDINEESVEIAKLSLWLRTAQKGRKLTSLSNNIKCGNSLIDDPAVAGEKAFHWPTEFPDVFAKGGFDVVIGNPPYGAFLTNNEKKYFSKNYEVTEYNFDTYNFFFEVSLKILKKDMYLGFITPNTFLVIENGVLLRRLLFEKNKLVELYETFDVFPDAVVEPINVILKKTPSKKTDKFKVLLEGRKKKEILNQELIHEDIFKQSNLIFNFRGSKQQQELHSKLLQFPKLSDYAIIKAGIKPYEKGKGIPPQSDEVVKLKPFNSYNGNDELWVKLIRGTQVNRYKIEWDGEFLKYGEWLAAPRNSELFLNPKILIRRTDDKLLSCYDSERYFGLNSIHCLQCITNEIELKFILALLNSKLLNWFFQFENFHMVGKPLAEVKVVFVERLPIVIAEQRDIFIKNVDYIIAVNQNLNELLKDFKNLLINKFEIGKLSEKLQNWAALDFKSFLAELQKAKIKFTLSEEADWLLYFTEQKQKTQTLKAEIDKTDREIDRMVYELYGLTEEEIGIVEGTNKLDSWNNERISNA